MRPVPPAPAPLARLETWERKLQVELLTRLFGGGARARELDARSWLRSAAAKSAIRAWWRAGQAHRFRTLAELQRQESVLFGTSTRYDEAGRPLGGPGAFAVVVEAPPCSSPQPYDLAASDALQVAYFPAAPLDQEAARLGLPASTAPARLKISARKADAALEAELLEGLRLWLTLGGVGARTRRGAGAIGVKGSRAAQELGLPTSPAELEEFLRTHCRTRPVAADLKEVFTLARTRRVLVGRPRPDAEEAQRALLRALRAARQERRSTGGGYGRSAWPEADAVRLKEGGSYRHAPQARNREQYPRAALGLPIVMHFKDGPVRDPGDHHILAALPEAGTWSKLERFASPILLRPVRVWQRGTVCCIPVAVFTDSTLPTSARPLVVTDPRSRIAAADVVSGYDIQRHADATLARVEAAFLKEGFRAL